MIYDPIGYQAVRFPGPRRVCAPDGRHDLNLMVVLGLYSCGGIQHTSQDVLCPGLPRQLKFFSSRHGCPRWLPCLSRGRAGAGGGALLARLAFLDLSCGSLHLLRLLFPPLLLSAASLPPPVSLSQSLSVCLSVGRSVRPSVHLSPFDVPRRYPPTRYAPAIKSACFAPDVYTILNCW